MFRSTALIAAATTAAAETITGTIFCDNQFEFYFNGQLVASDPVHFTPHQAVAVSFEWDEVSDKVYAIQCQDYASSSGYEYVNDRPALGDGSLLAEFSDGTVTSSNWKHFVVTHGPTAESVANGCSADNLPLCVVDDYGTPANWFSTGFDDSTWTAPTVYTAAEAGWGRSPTWTGSECCTMTSPLDRSQLGCNVNSDGLPIVVAESECRDPQTVFAGSSATFLWGSELQLDNKILFRHVVPAGGSPPTPPTPVDDCAQHTTRNSCTSSTCSDGVTSCVFDRTNGCSCPPVVPPPTPPTGDCSQYTTRRTCVAGTCADGSTACVFDRSSSTCSCPQ